MNAEQSLELAARAFLLARMPTGFAAERIYKGTENTVNVDADSATDPQTKAQPSVTLEAQGDHTQIGFRTGCYRGVLAVRVEAIAETTLDTEFNTLCEAVFTKFTILELATNLGAAMAAFDCLFAAIMRQGKPIRNGALWENVIYIECAYAQADL